MSVGLFFGRFGKSSPSHLISIFFYPMSKQIVNIYEICSCIIHLISRTIYFNRETNVDAVPIHVLICCQFNIKFQSLKVFICRCSQYFFVLTA